MDMSGRLVEGPALLEISVIDQNDNRPIFRELRYSGEVLEGSPTGRLPLGNTTLSRLGLQGALLGLESSLKGHLSL